MDAAVAGGATGGGLFGANYVPKNQPVNRRKSPLAG